MKFVAISDTDNQHKKLTLPKADIIIHAGDVSGRGHPQEIFEFLEWYRSLDYEFKILIAGNHDFYFEDHPDFIPEGIIYLNDNGTNINGINIWGSPIQPEFYNWAFNRKRGKEISKHWDIIPDDIDLLITHGPPFGYLDTNSYMQRVGCVDLLKRVDEIKPKYHVFGHVHEGYGIKRNDKGTRFINASVLNEHYNLVNQPITFHMS